MPKLRWFGGMKILRSEENTTRPFTAISPPTGRSSPAIERSVVVLPQPDGPSSVKNLPAGTSKVTSWAAFTAGPFWLWYSVFRPLTVSTFPSRLFLSFLDAEPFADPLRHHNENEQRCDQHHAERRQFHVLPSLPHFPDDNRDHFGAGAVQQVRARQFAHRHDHDVDPACQQAGLQQRQHDAIEG